MARAADEGVRDGKVKGHAERVGDEEHDQDQRRRDEERAKDPLAVEQLPDPVPDRHRVQLPAMIFCISFSAQAMASLVGVPVTALASMLGRMNEFVMSWTLSLGGAGHP